ncbi:type IV pilin protein [Ferrimonas pelagia]
MRKVAGITLIELMIVVVVLAILASIAYPSYQRYVGRGYRAEAHAQLSKLANLQEQYYLDHRTYSEDMTALGGAADPYVTESGRYHIDATVSSAGRYRLTAAAQGVQLTADGDCPTLTLNSEGERAPEECW